MPSQDFSQQVEKKKSKLWIWLVLGGGLLLIILFAYFVFFSGADSIEQIDTGSSDNENSSPPGFVEQEQSSEPTQELEQPVEGMDKIEQAIEQALIN